MIPAVLTNFFGGLAGKLIALAAAASLGAWGMAYVKNGQIARIELAYATEKTAAVEEARKQEQEQAKINLDAAVARARSAAYLAGIRAGAQQEIDNHVSNDSTCITFGLIRVLNAHATGNGVALPAPAGQPDDACAPISWRSFARELADDYAIGRDNADQLDKLIDNIRKQGNVSARRTE